MQLFDRRVALTAMVLAALYVPLILIGGSLMSEPLFAAFVLAALVAALHHRAAAHRHRWAVLAGVLAGLAILTRANAAVILLPLVVAVWDVRPRWSRRALTAPVLVVALAILTVAPWTVRNTVVLGSVVPVTTQLGTSLELFDTSNVSTVQDAADLLQQLAAELWSDERIVRMLARAERQYGERRAALLERLADHGIVASAPTGLNVWLPVSDEAGVAGELLRRGWAVAVGAPFRLTAPPAIRITVSSLEPDEAAKLAGDIAAALAPVRRTRAA